PEPARDEPLAPPIADDLPPEPTITPAPEPERQPAEEQAAPRPVRPRITAPAPAPPALAEEHTLIAETALLRSAHRALREGAPDRALALLNTHSARYPRGALREECAATRVLALCALDRRAEAQAEIAAFLAAYPNSMHTARVRAACAAP